MDECGVCSRCREQSPPPEPLGMDALLDAVEPYRDPTEPYDCIVALSGGRDSTYMTWLAVRELGLRVLAVTTDNGFVPEHTRSNLRRTVNELGIDHVVRSYGIQRRVFPGMLRAWVRRPSAATVGLLCTGCSFGRRLALPRAADERRIPLMLVGGGEPERSFAEPLLAGTGRVTRGTLAKGMARECRRNPSLLASPVRFTAMALEWGSRYLERRLMEVLGLDYPKRRVFPFRYVGWDEDTIMETITGGLGWSPGDICGTAWRSDCLVAPLKNYIYGGILGFHKVNELLSGMVRLGMLTREEALARLPSESSIDRGSLEELLGGCGVTLSELDYAISRARAEREATAR